MWHSKGMSVYKVKIVHIYECLHRNVDLKNPLVMSWESTYPPTQEALLFYGCTASKVVNYTVTLH